MLYRQLVSRTQVIVERFSDSNESFIREEEA